MERALREVSEMRGPFKVDPRRFAESVIEYNRGVALDALRRAGLETV